MTSTAASSMELQLNPLRVGILSCFVISTALLLPLSISVAGLLVAAVGIALLFKEENKALSRRMAVLFGAVLLLASSPINTDTSAEHFIRLGIPVIAVLVLPPLIFQWKDRGVIRYQFFPRKFHKLDMFYLLISIPLAWGILKWYFHINDFMPQQWYLPEIQDDKEIAKLFWGINGIGIWDELFFVNTVYATLRSIFPYRIANLVQAVVYTSVLSTMAFIGIGPILVFLFALTQGSMFEKSENLLYVLLVHLIVDYFLFWNIVAGYYPGFIPLG